MENKFYIETFFTEKNIIEKYIFIQKMFVLQIKYKSFLYIFILQKNSYHKKYIC